MFITPLFPRDEHGIRDAAGQPSGERVPADPLPGEPGSEAYYKDLREQKAQLGIERYNSRQAAEAARKSLKWWGLGTLAVAVAVGIGDFARGASFNTYVDDEAPVFVAGGAVVGREEYLRRRAMEAIAKIDEDISEIDEDLGIS